MGWAGTGERERIIYRMVRKAAEMGDTCPTNSVLATAIGCSSVATPAAYMQKMHKRGDFHVEVRQVSRVVTFPDGLATRDEWKDAIHWRRPKARRRQREAAKDILAERLSEGASIAAASRAANVSETRGYMLLDEIRSDLGWQAQ